jgi:hypothetical protein
MTPTPSMPVWLTSARHRSSYAHGEPFGTAHARVLGANHTACGEPAHSWRFFWEPFAPASENACPDCARLVREQPVPRSRASSL